MLYFFFFCAGESCDKDSVDFSDWISYTQQSCTGRQPGSQDGGLKILTSSSRVFMHSCMIFSAIRRCLYRNPTNCMFPSARCRACTSKNKVLKQRHQIALQKTTAVDGIPLRPKEQIGKMSLLLILAERIPAALL